MTELMTKTPKATLSGRRKPVAGPRGHFLLGSAPAMQHDRLGFLLRLTHDYGDVVHVRFLFWPAYMVNSPDGVKHVLQENYGNYETGYLTYAVFHRFVDKGLLTNARQSWLHQRGLIQPTFQRKHLANFS